MTIPIKVQTLGEQLLFQARLLLVGLIERVLEVGVVHGPHRGTAAEQAENHADDRAADFADLVEFKALKPCPLHPQKQTSAGAASMSEKCHRLTSCLWF